MNEFSKNFSANYKNILDNLIQQSGITTPADWLKLRQEIHTTVIETTNHVFDKLLSQSNTTITEQTFDCIQADTVRLEVTDKKTGIFCHRQLPMNYFENDNGVLLSGENIDGQPSQIAFLSDTALHKITDITGGGADKSHCR
jgi:hypothetical protein